MPERPERLLWLYASKIDGGRAAALDAENQSFARSWPAATCGLHCETCVATPDASDRVWLYRLATANRAVAARFNKLLADHCQRLLGGVGAGLTIKRRTNLPQPLVHPRPKPPPTMPRDACPQTDVGLHSVNDKYNGMLVSYSYYEGRYHNPPHLQLSTLIDLCSTVRTIWASVACGCHDVACRCCKGVGCFECFQCGCPQCDGTGWKAFVNWAKQGYQVDYFSGFPLARGTVAEKRD